MRVLEQRTRSYRDRRLHCIEEREEVGYQRVGQLCPEEMFQYLLVRGVAQCYGVEIILLHKLIEEVGTQHHRLRDHHWSMLVFVEFRITFYHLVKECQTSTLSSQRALSDTCEVCVAVVFQAVEHSHHSDVLHPSVLHYGVEDDLSVGIHILELMPCYVFQECRHREYGPCRKPTAHVVARDMIFQRLGRNLEDIVLQFLQRCHACYLLFRLRVTEDKVSESHVLLHQLVEVNIHLRRVLVDEVESLSLSLGTVERLRGVEYQWHILIAPAYLAQQLQSCLRVALLHMRESSRHTLHRETGVGYHSEGVLMILLIELHRLLVVCCEHHLRTSSLSLCCSVRVQGLGREALRLCEDIII